jgi:hypothetical protein
MSSFTASLFATMPLTNGHRLSAYALLFEGSRPTWEIHIGSKVFRFNPHSDHILEDGLWQLNLYCQIPQAEYKHDVHNTAPLTLEEEFGEEACQLVRKNLAADLLKTGFHFRLDTWPGVWMPNKETQIADWQKAGVPINTQADKKLFQMQKFVDSLSKAIDDEGK